MDEIVAKILEIEKSAQEIVREAEEKKSDIDTIIKTEKEKLRNSIFKEEKNKIEKEKSEIIDNAKDKAASYLNTTQKKIDAMDKMDKAVRASWVNQLYQKVLSR